MPSFFKKHKDASPTDPIPEDTNTSMPISPPVIVFPEPDHAEDLEMAKGLDSAFKAMGDAKQDQEKYAKSKSLTVLNKSGNLLNSIQTNVGTAQSYQSPLKTAYESEAMKIVRDGVNSLVDSLPGLIKALDEVAKLHPFIGIAVSAFRVVVELDVKRRDNDKKIGVLFVEMRDMMEALLQLRSIKDEETIGPDGQTIKARMQSLVKQTADDIKNCANACDTYSKKKLIVKVIKGSVWDGTLKSFLDLFTARRKAFTFALAIHVGAGIDDANRQLKALDAKLDTVLEFFTTRALSAEQLELTALVQRRGGPTAVMGNTDTLQEILKFKPASATVAGKRDREGGTEHSSHVGGDEVAAVKQELFENPEIAVRKNLEVFERKFRMQQRELAEEMQRVVHHEGDRVIAAVTSGPHDRIIDPDIHEIWKEMRWPGHVKARHFVLALRDYYRQHVEDKKRNTHGEEKIPRVADDDEWALEWITINRMQAIAEAFDDDASGFITIAEVNKFTSSRPKEWSLPHWLAYWAIGWQMTATYYRDKIVELCAKMFSIRPLIHSSNRNAVDKYLQTVWKRVCTLTASLVSTSQADTLQARFQLYVDAEEQRLREGLETVRYDIDAIDTLSLITGPGRIEKYIFPLLYLLLRRDFEIFRMCRTTVIHKDELWDSADTLVWVFDAVDFRHNDLEALFKQQKLDVNQQFKNWASELFDYWHDDNKFWSLESLREVEFMEIPYDDEKEDQNVDMSKLLNYPSAADDLYGPPVEDILTEADSLADEAVRVILGRWNGHMGATRWTAASMTTFCFHASADHNTYEASGAAAHGTGFTTLGSYKSKEDGTVEYSFVRTYAARVRKVWYLGTLTDDGETLSGKWGYEENALDNFFLFKRVAPEILVARPPPSEFEENRIRALWKYATTAALNEARRKLFSWSLLKDRRDRRKEYLELLQREEDSQTTEEDLDRFAFIEQKSTFDEARCYYVLNDYRQRPVPAHFQIICDACTNSIFGARMVCLECGQRFTFDFCDKPSCIATVMSRDDVTSPHLPTHDFVKIRTGILHYREIGKVLRMAKAGLERANDLLNRAAGAEVMPTSPVAGADGEGEVGTGATGGDENKGGDEAAKEGDGETPGSVQDTAPAAPAAETKVPVIRRENSTMESDTKSEAEVPVLTCISCSSTVTRPCWYCIDCPDDANVFICKECDEEKGGITVGDHLPTHSLVRCTVKEDEEKGSEDPKSNTEDRLTALETQMSQLTTQMGKIEALLQALLDGQTGMPS